MRRAGEAVRAAQGLVIVRTPEGSLDPDSVDRDHPGLGSLGRIGEEVVDGSLSTVGQVVDVFGPVSRPYLAVSPNAAEPGRLIGERLYLRD